MREALEQMREISYELMKAADDGDMDRVIALLKRRQELAKHMGRPDPADPEVISGEVAKILKEIVTMDGEIEGKIRSLMNTLQNAILVIKGEQDIVRGYLKQTDSENPKFIEREG